MWKKVSILVCLSTLLYIEFNGRAWKIVCQQGHSGVILSLVEIKQKFETMGPENHADRPKVTPHVILTGTAKEGSAGPPIGLVDIGVNEAAYVFRVALPGVEKNQNKIKCEIQREGRVCIEGVVPELAVPNDSWGGYRMPVQQLCPPGPFSVSFNLPGPVDPRLFSPKFRPDGILEVVVMKLRGQIPNS